MDILRIKYVNGLHLLYLIVKYILNVIFHKSTLEVLMLTGIALSSVRMHRNSPETHITATQIMLMTHQDKNVGKHPLKYQQNTKWKKCTVHVKSKHCLVLCTTYHRPKELKERYITYLRKFKCREKCSSFAWAAFFKAQFGISPLDRRICFKKMFHHFIFSKYRAMNHQMNTSHNHIKA